MHLFVLFYSIFTVIAGLRLSRLDVPAAVIRGEPAWLNCSYDLEKDELYSVKWYKNNVEFYRYLPTDRPPGQKYDLQGVYVDVSKQMNRFFFCFHLINKLRRTHRQENKIKNN